MQAIPCRKLSDDPDLPRSSNRSVGTCSQTLAASCIDATVPLELQLAESESNHLCSLIFPASEADGSAGFA